MGRILPPPDAVAPGRTVGQQMLEDDRLPLISATGSTRMGRIVGETVGLPRLPDGLYGWLVALDSPFAYLPEHWIEIR